MLTITFCSADDSGGERSTTPTSLTETIPIPTHFPTCIGNIPAFFVGSIEYGELRAYSTNTNRGGWPYVIVRPRLATHVARAVKCAAKAGLKVCGRSGGHALDGRNLCQDAVMIDVARIRHTIFNKTNKVLSLGAGCTLGEALYAAHEHKRWFPSGVCPGVGIAGYLLGGGLGPYMASLGVAADSVAEVTMVNAQGELIRASQWLRPKLYWATMGAGGSQFGIVTEFRLRTTSSRRFDKSVVFTVHWPLEYAGELIHKWTYFNEQSGSTWARVNAGWNGLKVVGACYNVDSKKDCLWRLQKTAFWHVPGRSIGVMEVVRSAVLAHGFFGPGGDWARKPPTNARKALLRYRYKAAGGGSKLTYKSTFLRFPKRRPSAEYWQKYANFVVKSKLKTIPWFTAQLTLMSNAVRVPKFNSFAHRQAHVVTHFIIGPGSAVEKKIAYWWMRNHLRPYTTGVYVNYQEPELGRTYAKAYWGHNLKRLRFLKSRYDPDMRFANPQPIPLIR